MSAEGSGACRIALEDFEGPLDLLLYLIRRDELDVTTINVSIVADQYLDYIRAAQELNLDVAGEYLVMAATLARLKSRSLLPVEREIMEDSEDPMESLMRHIVLYRAFKEVAGELRESESIWRDSFPVPGERERFSDSDADHPVQASLLDLLLAVEEMSSKNAPPPEHRISKPLITLTQCVNALERMLPPGRKALFRDTLGASPDETTVVSFFSTVLELVKRGWLSTSQRYPMGEIEMIRTERWTGSA